MVELITPQQLAEIGEALGERAVQLQRDHINKQEEVSGGSFPSLSPATVAMKERNKRKGVRGNAEMRMKATNDFVQNAFQYEITSNGIVLFISKKIHKRDKIANERKRWETNKAKMGAKGKKPKTAKPTYTNKQGKIVTYEDIAKWQLRGKSDQGERKSGNPGADFFGFSKDDENTLKTTFTQMAYPIIKKGP